MSDVWTDTHCHLQEAFIEDPEQLDEVLKRAQENGVERAICIGTGTVESQQAVNLGHLLADSSSPISVWSSVGMHPHSASHSIHENVALLESTMSLQGSSRRRGSIVAVGECGLDYFYEFSPREVQRASFIEQIALAKRFDLTLVIHTRDAWDDTLAILREQEPPERTIIHCFTGGPDEADSCLELGCFLSFSGIVTFKNAEPIRIAARRCPDDRILVETDAPFLAPVPYRGKPNEPAYVAVVGEAVAQLRGVKSSELADLSSSNAISAFGLQV